MRSFIAGYGENVRDGDDGDGTAVGFYIGGGIGGVMVIALLILLFIVISKRYYLMWRQLVAAI